MVQNKIIIPKVCYLGIKIILNYQTFNNEELLLDFEFHDFLKYAAKSDARQKKKCTFQNLINITNCFTSAGSSAISSQFENVQILRHFEPLVASTVITTRITFYIKVI